MATRRRLPREEREPVRQPEQEEQEQEQQEQVPRQEQPPEERAQDEAAHLIRQPRQPMAAQ